MFRPTALLLTTLLAAAPALAGWDEGTRAFRSGDFNRAASEFSSFVDQSPDSWQAHYMLGMSLARLGKDAEAVHHLKKAHEIEPGDPGVALALGKAWSSAGRHADAARVLGAVDAAALDTADKKAALYQMRAEARLKAGDEKRALADLDQLRKLRPGDAKIQQAYAATALRAGDGAAAVAALKTAAASPGADADVKRSYAQALLLRARGTGDKAVKKQSYAEAAKVAAGLAAADPSYDNLMLQASAELGAGSWDAAARTGARAAAKKPTDWLPHYYVGQAHTSAGRYAEAEAPLRRALQAASGADQKKVWSQLGFLYEKQTQYAKALEAYDRAGDSNAMARVRENRETAEYNEQVEAENEKIEAMRREAERLERELEDLGGSGGTNGGG